MHELSLAEGVLDAIEQAARTQGFRHVVTVFLDIGEFAAVEPEALRFCFEAVARDTLAAGARLEMECIPGSTALRVRELDVE